MGSETISTLGHDDFTYGCLGGLASLTSCVDRVEQARFVLTIKHAWVVSRTLDTVVADGFGVCSFRGCVHPPEFYFFALFWCWGSTYWADVLIHVVSLRVVCSSFHDHRLPYATLWVGAPQRNLGEWCADSATWLA
jgi:hypothetical protein